MSIIREALLRGYKYDASTGLFHKRLGVRPCGEELIRPDASGSVANGARYLFILGRNYTTKRLVWLYHRGTWPSGSVRSLDGDSLNTRIENITTDRLERAKPKKLTVTFLAGGEMALSYGNCDLGTVDTLEALTLVVGSLRA